MRHQYLPLTEKDWLQYYSNQQGGLIIGFKGNRYQRGAGIGNILKGLFRMVLPLAKTAGKVIGKQALESGTDLLSDILKGDTVKSSLKRHGRQAVGKLVDKGAKRLVRKIQTGQGLGVRRSKARKSIKAMGYRRKRYKKDALGSL